MRIFKRIFSFPQLGFLSLHGLVCLWKCSGIYLEDQDNYSFYVYCLASQNLSLKTGFPSVMRTPPCPCYIMRIYCHHFMLVFVVNSVYNCISAHLFALQNNLPFQFTFLILQKTFPLKQLACLGPRHKIHRDVLAQNRCWFSTCVTSPSQHTHRDNLYCLNIYTAYC